MAAPKRKRDLAALGEALDKYKSQGNNEFFTLADDKDTARVRLLYETAEELDWYVVHEVTIGGKKRWLQCTEEADCPCCVRANTPQLKLFLQLEDQRDMKVKTWERGQKMIPKIMELFTKYGAPCTRLFEVERQGKKGDSNTDYEFFALEADGKSLADLPPKQDFTADNGFILVKSTEDMEKIMQGTYQYQPVDTQPRGTQPPAGNGQAGGGAPAGSSNISGSEVF